MGRPVFQVFTRDELAAGSHAVIVGAFEDPRARVDEDTGTRFHRVRVLEILDENPIIHRSHMHTRDFAETRVEAISVGASPEILAFVSGLKSASLRRGPSSSGAAYPARRYRVDREVLDEDALIFFISRGDSPSEETADLTVEPLSRRGEVEQAIARDRALRHARAEATHLAREDLVRRGLLP